MKPGVWLWFSVAVLFALMACAWTAMFFFAGKALVEPVPLDVPAAQTTEAR